MLVRSDIQRSVAAMTIDLHKSMDRRRISTAPYQLTEREYQAQYDFSGTVGSLPVEAEVTIPFSVLFLGDAGNQRDSNLDRPHAKLAVEMLHAPAGSVPYHYVKSWQQDPDFNFIGAIVVIGMSCPALFVTGATPPDSTAFAGKLHASFQGFGVLMDDENSLGLSADNADAFATIMDMGVG